MSLRNSIVEGRKPNGGQSTKIAVTADRSQLLQRSMGAVRNIRETAAFSRVFSHLSMNHRINSIIHSLSACYWALATALAFLVGPHPAYSVPQFRLCVSSGVALIGLDLLAGLKQWRSAATGRLFSIVLHLGVTIFVVSLMTFEFLQTQPKSFFVWFKADDYWFLAALGFVRVLIGTALLLGNKEVH